MLTIMVSQKAIIICRWLSHPTRSLSRIVYIYTVIIISCFLLCIDVGTARDLFTPGVLWARRATTNGGPVTASEPS